jgi:hypothetical protein
MSSSSTSNIAFIKVAGFFFCLPLTAKSVSDISLKLILGSGCLTTTSAGFYFISATGCGLITTFSTGLGLYSITA